MPIAISGFALVAFSLLYLYLRMRRDARAKNVNEFFIFDKQVSSSQYFDTTASYSFQVVVTVFFVYWAFLYGIGMFYYVIVWFAGIYLFQLSASKLISFATSGETLHGFLEHRYGASHAVRRIAATCTLLGLTGTLLIEVSLTTDVLTALGVWASGQAAWTAMFFVLLFVTWLYLVFGGYKSAVMAYSVQLPVVYAGLAVTLCYLIWSVFQAGHYRQGILVGGCSLALWSIIMTARLAAARHSAHIDNATVIAVLASIASISTTVTCAWIYSGYTGPAAVPKTADLFSPARILSQDWMVILGFTVLNLGTQFSDMTAWQRVSSLNLSGPVSSQVRQLRHSIGETKWESPATWGFGIVMGIALHYSGLFTSASDASGAITSFLRYIAHDPAAPWIAAYVVLPCVVVAFVSMMYSTADALLATIVYTWMCDLSPTSLGPGAADSSVLHRTRVASFCILFLSGAVFAFVHKGLNVNIFLVLNTVASAQFSIVFLSVGALYLPEPKRYVRLAIATGGIALLLNFAAALYCYILAFSTKSPVWEERFYVLPSITSAAGGVIAAVTLRRFLRLRDAPHL